MRLLLTAAVVAMSVMTAQAQSAGVPGEAAPGVKGIGLTPVQKKLIYENTSGERQQRVPEDQVSLGAPIPDSLMLNEMPVHVKDEIGVLRDFKFAVVQGARSVLIVDPAKRRIVDIVTRDEGMK
ncbi:MAG: DUF1236 domain-containing protein [Pseudorhodoplanes sp.]|nr:DUF1236 domain-containing protein [Pseudorhodoplanes sp.]